MIHRVYQKIVKFNEEIEAWFQEKESKTIPFYSSFDIRNAGYKAVVIDSNVFPSGFNNLCSECYPDLSKIVKSFIDTNFSGTIKIGLISEYINNIYYYDNIARLKRIIKEAGYSVELGAIGLSVKITVTSFSEGDITLLPVKKHQNKLHFNGFTPDLIVLNDDLSSTDTSQLLNCSQYITPPVNVGWFNRKKHRHFTIKNELIKEISDIIQIDRWLIGAYFEYVENINFKEKKNFNVIAEKIDSVITQIRKKYNEYDINHDPFVFVKANSSTYGMNVIPFNSGEQFLQINSKQRVKMHKSKGGREVSDVIIQEGVITKDRINNQVSEPVLYCIGESPIGGFFRVNSRRTERENLNTKGMSFFPHLLCPMKADHLLSLGESNTKEEDIEVYKFLSRLGVLAISYEIEDSV